MNYKYILDPLLKKENKSTQLPIFNLSMPKYTSSDVCLRGSFFCHQYVLKYENV